MRPPCVQEGQRPAANPRCTHSAACLYRASAVPRRLCVLRCFPLSV